MSRTKKLTLCALLAALGVLLLFLSGVVSPVLLALTALAGLIPAVAVMHCGPWWALGTYAVTAALALLLLPEKTGAVWYVLFFGHYPVVKSLLERISSRILCWICKIAAFSACMAVLYVLFRGFFLAALPERALWILGLALVVAFVLYDIAFSALISFYQRRIAPYVGRAGRA